MERSQKLTFAALGAVALLFVLVLAFGLAGDRGGEGASSQFAPAGGDPRPAGACQAASPQASGWVGGLGRFLVKKMPLKARDTQAPCLQGAAYRLAPGQVCPVEIPPSSFAARRACLQLTQGQGLSVQLTQPGTFPLSRQLAPGAEVPLDIHARKEARLTLTCQGQGECVVAVR